MGKKSTPSAPDPVATASAQASANAEAVRESARVNQINTSGPWGRSYFTGTIGKDDRTQVTELSPDAQQTYDNQAGVAKSLSGYGQNLAQQIQGLPAFSINGQSSSRGLPPGAVGATLRGGYSRDIGGVPGSTSSADGQGQRLFFPASGGGADIMRVRDLPEPSSTNVGVPTANNNISAPGTSSRVEFNAPAFSKGQIGFNVSDLDRLLSVDQMRPDGLPSAPWEGDRSADIDKVEKATYDRAFNQISPDIERQRAQLQTQLANQGITLNSDTYKREIDRFDQGIGRQLNDLSLGAVGAGRAEDSRLYGLGLAGRGQAFGENESLFGRELASKGFDQSELNRLLSTRGAKATFDQSEAQRLFSQALAEAGFNSGEDQRMFGNDNQARDRSIQEMITERQMPMNELAAILQGSPALQTPQGVNPGQYQVQPADIMGATYANYQNQLNSANSNRQGLYGLLGAGAGLAGATYGGGGWSWSDRRLKSSIKRIGRLPNGLGVYSYVKFGRPEIGVMADEVRTIRPWAVARVGGFDVVNYAEALR